MRESDAAHFLIDENEFEAKAFVDAAENQRGSSAAAIDDNTKLPEGIKVENGGKLVEVRIDGVLVHHQGSQTVPLDEGELLEVIDIEQFVGFGGGQVNGISSEELEGIPFGSVMTGADGNAAGGIEAADGVLQDGRGSDA